jgi:chromosome segregation protein
MDTGVGTNSYSLMEQGRIDRILSSRPDDRREVFEEASGITKFKADKKEAIRKLDHTEANLLRLADIVKEVKRQIISLQRQAGKAKRYKELQAQLRGLDLYVSRKRLDEMEQSTGQLKTSLEQYTKEHDDLKKQIDENEQKETRLRHEISDMENTIANAMDASMRARSELERARQLAKVNRDRIAELKALTERDNRDVSDSQQKIEAYR